MKRRTTNPQAMTQEEIKKRIEDYANTIKDATFGVSLMQEEIDRLNHWGAELLKLWGPVDEYVRGLDEVKVGDSVSAKALEILKRIESQAKEIDGLNKSLEDFADRLDKKIYEVIELKETIESYAKQIDKLANFIMASVPGEPSQSEGAVDCAMRIIESQAKEIERLTDRIKSMEPELSMLRSYQGMTVTEQNEMIEQISQLKEALNKFLGIAEIRSTNESSLFTADEKNEILNLLNDKK